VEADRAAPPEPAAVLSMARVDFESLPDSARIWIFAADRELEPEEERELLDAVDDFLEEWNAHGTPLRGARSWRYHRFLIVGVDEEAAPPSGCSIDALVRVLKEKERELDVGLLDNAPVWYRGRRGVRTAPRSEFREMAKSGEVTPGTVVFDNSLTRMEDLREGAWERPARESWHGRVFFPEVAAG